MVYIGNGRFPGAGIQVQDTGTPCRIKRLPVVCFTSVSADLLSRKGYNRGEQAPEGGSNKVVLGDRSMTDLTPEKDGIILIDVHLAAQSSARLQTPKRSFMIRNMRYINTTSDFHKTTAMNSSLRNSFTRMAMGRKFLVCSIGNPGAAYAKTRHNAGHIMTDLLREVFGSGQFSKDKAYGGNVSFPMSNQTYTFWQSRSFMNISGKGVRVAWNSFLSGLEPEERQEAVLVIVHDELEVALGKVKVKKTGSAGGHNGLVSIIQAFGTKDFCRIGIGIGRPETKDSTAVSNYVLCKMEPHELKVLEKKSLLLVIAELEKIAEFPKPPGSPKLQ